MRLPRKPIELVCMRLDRMTVTRPDQDESRVCARCGETVGIYPSGQAVLRQRPTTTIVCDVCAGIAAYHGIPAPGALEEILARALGEKK